MRAPLLLPLLLLGVSSQDAIDTITTRPEENGQITTTGTSKAQKTTTASKPEDTPSAPTTPPAANQVATTINNPGNPPPTSVILPTTPQATTTTTSSLGNPSSTPATSPAANQGTTSANNLGNPPPTPTPSPQQPQPINTTIISGTPATTPAATSSVAQEKTVPPASSGSSSATTAVSAAPSHASGPPATPGGLTTAVTPYPSVGAQARQPLNQSTSTAASTGVPTSSHAPGLRDHNVTSPTSVTKQPQSSPASPDQGLTFSTRPGSIKTSVTPFDGSVSPTTSKASASSSPGSIHKVSEATTPTLEADQGRPASVSTKPTRTDPASAQPSSPTPDDQMVSSCSGQHQTPSTSSQNEVICEVKAQNNCPMIYLKEEKSCAEWKNASMNISFFESFCSTGQRAFNASRDRCTVTLTSHKPWSQQWAVQATVHFPLDPENIFKELKEKDKFKELGIVNTTYDKMEREMVINDELSTPLIITIVTLAGSLLLIAAIYGCCHQRFSQKKDQNIHPDLPGFDDGHVALIFNRLTEELQTMENGYHDNPTLEVMETSSEMQEKKVNLNGELGDSWIVPLDTLMKEDLEEEEDTHL